VCSEECYLETERHLHEAIQRAAFPETLRELVYVSLCQPGKLLGGASPAPWPSLVLACAAAAGGATRAGVQVAAAVEVFMAAADVLDDLEDGDESRVVAAAGPAQALNAATAMLVLSFELLSSLADAGIPHHRVPIFTRVLAQGSLTAAGGQHLDLAAGQDSRSSLSQALSIARTKAGTLAATASRLGAMTGTENPTVLALYESLGQKLGIIGQLQNDIKDAKRGSSKTDRVRGKNTIPLLFDLALTCVSCGADRDDKPRTPGTTEDDVSDAATAMTLVTIDLERMAALSILDQLASHGQNIDPLTRLLD